MKLEIRVTEKNEFFRVPSESLTSAPRHILDCLDGARSLALPLFSQAR